jgi:hypothetical protein
MFVKRILLKYGYPPKGLHRPAHAGYSLAVQPVLKIACEPISKSRLMFYAGGYKVFNGLRPAAATW